jgi:hypothetical protein
MSNEEATAGLAGNLGSVTYPATKFTSRCVTLELSPESGNRAHGPIRVLALYSRPIRYPAFPYIWCQLCPSRQLNSWLCSGLSG